MIYSYELIWFNDCVLYPLLRWFVPWNSRDQVCYYLFIFALSSLPENLLGICNTLSLLSSKSHSHCFGLSFMVLFR